MKTIDILNKINHRPFEIPSHKWIYYQEWNKAVFLHWEVNPNLIKSMLPKGIELDIINGKTWVSLVAFDMNNISVKRTLKPPYIADFQEINIRVYVIYNGKPGVYFLSMEANKQLSCTVLKNTSKLPYRYSKMNRSEFLFQSKNNTYNDSFNLECNIENISIKKDKTDLWLTERYALFQDYKNYIIEYDIHHIEWPIQKINIQKLEINYPRFNHLINDKADKIHYSQGVQVLTWDKTKIKI